jgi:NAD(P)-dependent dehydrogenase (short-subunit alcohol dehydrogenase family)
MRLSIIGKYPIFRVNDWRRRLTARGSRFPTFSFGASEAKSDSTGRMTDLSPPSFDVRGRVAVITGGYGVLGSSIARGLAAAGARVAVLGRRADAAHREAEAIARDGGESMAVVADVLDREQVSAACDRVIADWGRVDILVNAAGGNVARARSDTISVFEIPLDAFDEALRVNLHGTVIPTMAVAEHMARQQRGAIVNISSMAALQALSGVMGYSIAKAGIDNFTRWLAVDMARRHGDGVRVNAIAPGFFVTKQNRAVLLNEDGSYTERSQRVIRQTPMGRFGRPEELLGAVQWLCSDAASFVTGAVIAIDGGFSVFSGV